MLVEEEMEKSPKISNLRNANDVDYAPWMGIDKEEETMIRLQVKAESAAHCVEFNVLEQACTCCSISLVVVL